MKNASKFVGNNWIKCFEEAISEHEEQETNLRVNTNRVYLDKRRVNTAFITINAFCNKCNKNAYSIKVNEDPRQTSANLVNVDITRKQEHKHDLDKKTRITKDERVQVYEEVKLNFNGSAKNYVDALKGCGSTQNPTYAVVRQILSEQKNLDMISTDWITNILAATDAADNFVQGNKVFGYVQTLDVSILFF